MFACNLMRDSETNPHITWNARRTQRAFFSAQRYPVAMKPTAPLPPDRSHISTEQRHPRSMDMDALATDALVDLMIEDHQAVIHALQGASPALTKFINELVPRMRDGGRLMYIGAGSSG